LQRKSACRKIPSVTAAPATPRAHPAAAQIAARFDALFAPLLLLIAARFRILGPVTVPLWTRLNRARQRLARLLACLAAGPLPPPRAPATPRAPRTPRGSSPPVRLPAGRGWLLAVLRHEAAVFTGRLEALLADPEVQSVLAAAPQAARILRPIARSLGCAPGPLALEAPRAPRVRKPRPRPAPKPKRLTRKQREAILWYPNMEGRPMRLLPRRLPPD
jgi:hypothetical protein